MLGLSLSLTGVAVRGSGSSIEQITAAGGTVKDGEQFNVYYAAGGLTGATSVTIGGVVCTSVTIVNDYNLTATAPSDDLLHNTSYTLSIVGGTPDPINITGVYFAPATGWAYAVYDGGVIPSDSIMYYDNGTDNS